MPNTVDARVNTLTNEERDSVPFFFSSFSRVLKTQVGFKGRRAKIQRILIVHRLCGFLLNDTEKDFDEDVKISSPTRVV